MQIRGRFPDVRRGRRQTGRGAGVIRRAGCKLVLGSRATRGRMRGGCQGPSRMQPARHSVQMTRRNSNVQRQTRDIPCYELAPDNPVLRAMSGTMGPTNLELYPAESIAMSVALTANRPSARAPLCSSRFSPSHFRYDGERGARAGGRSEGRASRHEADQALQIIEAVDGRLIRRVEAERRFPERRRRLTGAQARGGPCRPGRGRRQPGGTAAPARRCDAGSASGPAGSTSE